MRMPAATQEEIAAAWYVAMTQPRHEKAVATRLTGRGVECFLPLHEAQHRWSRGIARVDLPLFPGYVFTRLPITEKLKVLTDSSVLRLVTFGGQPASVPEAQIAALRESIARRLRLEPHPYLPLGSRARIHCGPFRGLEGTVIRKNNRTTVVLSIDLIERAVAIELEACDVASVA